MKKVQQKLSIQHHFLVNKALFFIPTNEGTIDEEENKIKRNIGRTFSVKVEFCNYRFDTH